MDILFEGVYFGLFKVYIKFCNVLNIWFFFVYYVFMVDVDFFVF